MKVLLIGKLKNDPWNHHVIKNKEQILKNFNPSTIDDDKASILIDNNRLLILIPKNNDAKVNRTIGESFNNDSNNISEIYVCSHELPTSNIRFPFFILHFSHVGGNQAYRLIKNLIEELIPNNKAQENFDKLCNYIKESSDENLKTHLLHLFLPLDIDMQAIKILLDKGENNKAVDYLKEMLRESKKYYEERVPKKVQELLAQISDEKKKAEVKDFFEKIKGLLETLIKLQPDQIPDFSNDQNKELKEYIKNFHDWYCALAECLKDKKA